MTKAELWAFYVSKNPSFEADGWVTLTPTGLKKLFDQTWDVAHQAGMANGKAFQEHQNSMKKDPLNDLMKGFGFAK
jgi:hypothetical protein